MLNLKKISLLAIALLATGCVTSPTQLGISKAQWQSYTPAQRQEILNNYRSIQNTSDLSPAQAATAANIRHTTIAVNIQGGQIMMPPFTQLQSYMPINFSLQEDECKQIKVFQLDQKQQTLLKACYLDQVLYLDPSRYDITKSKGSLIFNAIPLWQQSFTYRDVSSTGYTQLTHAEITVKSDE